MVSYLDLAVANDTIKTTDIKGKDYAEVNQRIKAFRIVYPTGTIETEMVSNENGVCIFKAKVGYTKTCIDKKAGILADVYTLLGTGTAYEKEDSSFINKTSYIENCETSAVGRALGMAGFGIDVSVASAEEVANAIQNQENITITEEEANEYVINFGKKHNGEKLKDVIEEDKQYVTWYINNHPNDTYFIKCYELITGEVLPTEAEQEERISLISEIQQLELDTDTDHEKMLNHFKVGGISEMTILQLKECKEILAKKMFEKIVSED